MATYEQVLELHRRNPEFGAKAIAAALDCSSAYVRATAARRKIKLPHSKPDGIKALGRAARDAGLTVEQIKRMKKS